VNFPFCPPEQKFNIRVAFCSTKTGLFGVPAFACIPPQSSGTAPPPLQSLPRKWQAVRISAQYNQRVLRRQKSQRACTQYPCHASGRSCDLAHNIINEFCASKSRSVLARNIPATKQQVVHF